MPNQHEQYLAWIAALKEGDEVVVKPAGHYSEELLARVDHVTPTRRFIVGKFTFNSNGDQHGKNYMGRAELFPPTEENRNKIEHRKLAKLLGNVQWEQRPLDTLRRVAAVLDELQPLPAPAGESEVAS